MQKAPLISKPFSRDFNGVFICQKAEKCSFDTRNKLQKKSLNRASGVEGLDMSIGSKKAPLKCKVKSCKKEETPIRICVPRHSFAKE